MDITLSIDDETLRKAHKVTAEKNTTLAAMVQDYLASVADADSSAHDTEPNEEAVNRVKAYLASLTKRDLAAQDEGPGSEAVAKLRESWELLSRPMGPRNWTRDDLYDRPKAYAKHR